MISQQRALVRMPEVQGMPYIKAKLILEHLGLVLDGVTFQESYEARDTVLAQKPARGQMIYSGEKVLLTVSRESYIKWLPSIYQHGDLNGRNFIRDLLWVVQHMFGSVEEKLDKIHTYFDPYEAPPEFLPWLASWSAMVLDEDWPLAKKRRLIRKAIELYRTRGTVKGIKLFLSLFTGHEPTIRENQWPFRGWRIGISSGIGVDTVILPPVNLAHAFIIEMPVSYKDVSTEAMVRIHEIIQLEKPANCQYYLRFAVDQNTAQLQEFLSVGSSAMGVDVSESDVITSEEDLARALSAEAPIAASNQKTMALPATDLGKPADDPFSSTPRTKPPLRRAPRADVAPIEGQEDTARRTIMATTSELGTTAPMGKVTGTARRVIESDRTMILDPTTDRGPKKK